MGIVILVLLLALLIAMIIVICRHGKQSMKSLLLTNLIVIVPYILCTIRFGYRPNWIMQFIIPLYFIIIIAMLIVNGVGLWRFGLNHKFGSLIILLLSTTCFFSSDWGHKLRMYVFEKRLPQYERAVEDFKVLIKNESLALKGGEIPKEYRHLAHIITGDKDESGNYEIAFVWGHGFSAKHSSFCYRSDGHPGKDWSLHNKIKGNWFKVGN